MRDQQDFEDAIGCAMDAIRLNDPDATMHALADLADLGEDALRAAARKLAAAGACLISTLFPDEDPDPLVELRLTDIDGSTVQIDDLEPSLRSAIRMVLCLVNGNEDGATEQLDLVHAASGDADYPVGLASVVIQLLMWTAQMRGDVLPSDRPMR
jgi:hypothetical protein